MATEPGFTTYQQLLDAMTEGAMSLVRRLSEAAHRKTSSAQFSEDIRNFCWMSGIVRRAIIVSQYLDTVPAPAEQTHGKLMPALDWVLPFFAQHKMPLDEFTEMVDSELLGLGEAGEDLSEDEAADVVGRRPIVLVAELCRDFGMAMHGLPTEWLSAVPSDLRLYCARAAIAGIDFSKKPRPAARRHSKALKG